MDKGRYGMATALLLAAMVWGVNAFWLLRDTRPPVWDMAMHQSYALNYLAGSPSIGGRGFWDLSGNYPPFVHLAMALCYLIFHPGPHVAVLANIPATLLLFWAVHELAVDLAGSKCGRWATVVTALVPYLFWMSRETILDYWLSAWLAAALVVLRKTRGFESRGWSLLLGFAVACGLLTKWFLAALFLFPLVDVAVSRRIWKDTARLVNLADSALIAGIVAGLWYLPNLPRLVSYFSENAKIGAEEGEPPVMSFQSLIYYLRVLEGYQLFGALFLLLAVSLVFVWRGRLLRDGKFLAATIVGGWLAMTLLRTKDPRFTMPLLGLLTIVPGAWIASWGKAWAYRAAKVLIVGVLGIQAYAINFGISWLPQAIVLAKGYQGSLRWDWNLYLQHYFQILGAPKREDWRHDEILSKVVEHAAQQHVRPALALVPDLPRFSAANFHLLARLRGMAMRVDHPRSAASGIQSFDGYNYVLMTEGDQGMPWSTRESRALNRIIVDQHQIFRLIGLYPLPNGDYVRLYFIDRG